MGVDPGLLLACLGVGLQGAVSLPGRGKADPPLHSVGSWSWGRAGLAVPGSRVCRS